MYFAFVGWLKEPCTLLLVVERHTITWRSLLFQLQLNRGEATGAAVWVRPRQEPEIYNKARFLPTLPRR